ncbi:MAG: hypothetical protein RR428_10105 [Coprobacillus sp.]
MITKNNIIIFSLIILFAFICFFLKGQLSSSNTLTTPVNNTNQTQESMQQNQQQNSDIYIDC